MMLPEFTAPISSASKLAAFSEWATPMSSAWRIRSFASRGWPSRSAAVRVWALLTSTSIALPVAPRQALDQEGRIRRRPRRTLHQLRHRPAHPVPVYVLAQPLAQRLELAAREGVLQWPDRAIGRGEELRTIHVAERVRREVADQPIGPMDVLETSLAVVRRTHAEPALVQL